MTMALHLNLILEMFNILNMIEFTEDICMQPRYKHSRV